MLRYNRYAYFGILRETLTRIPIHCRTYTSARDKTKVCREERRRYDSQSRTRGRDGWNRGIARRTREGRETESLCELAHNGNAKVNSLPGRKSTVGHLGNRMCILNVSQGLYVWIVYDIVYDILLAFLIPVLISPLVHHPFLRWCPLSFYSLPFSAASTSYYH